ncbi:MAG: nucleotidyltransferase domain-containing protein [Anaerolineae bacterium]|nr:nucleotidyltransferase domain-containing protein [Anaerolineae bacterium]
MTRPELSSAEAAALRMYVEALHARYGARLRDVMLFGSRARGDVHPDSDIDVLVILERPSAQELSEVRGLAFDVWLAHGVLLSIRAMSLAGWQALAARQSLFYRHILRDGISLLETHPSSEQSSS